MIGSALGGAISGSNASHDAAGQQVDAANNATALQKAMYEQNQRNLSPYMQGGTSALSSILDMFKSGQLGGQFTGADYLANKDPGYDFQLQQGQQALMNSQAATNGALSGAALKSLIGFNQGMASTGYQNAYNRWLSTQQNKYGQLSDIAKLGENAAAGAGNTGVGYANGISNTITGAGNAAAAGTIGSANAISSGLNNYGALRYLDSGGSGGSGGGIFGGFSLSDLINGTGLGGGL
ncbi:MAG TPA: hypothetical protein VIN03_16725 [Roseateles sp.]